MNPPARMSASLRLRLSLMMFLQYMAPGAVLPILSHYLKNYLDFSAFQVGLILAMPAVAAVFAPLVMARIVDRLISAEALLSLCHLAAAVFMFIVYKQHDFWPFLAAYLLYGFAFMPTFALSNAVAFHHVSDAKRDFGGLRMWGPASWVAVALGFSYVWLGGGMPEEAAGQRLSHALLLSSIISLCLGVYGLTLPRSSVRERQKGQEPPNLRRTLGILTQPALLVLCVITFFNQMIHQTYYYGMGPFLNQLGFPDRHIMPAMSMGQLGEVFALLFLGFFIARLGFKKVLLTGIAFQAIRTILFATHSEPFVLGIIPSHGICYGFFFATAYIYVETHCTPADRGGAQQLFNILTFGFGNLFGNVAAGKLGDLATPAGAESIDFHVFWLVSAGAALALALGLSVFFREKPTVSPESG